MMSITCLVFVICIGSCMGTYVFDQAAQRSDESYYNYYPTNDRYYSGYQQPSYGGGHGGGLGGGLLNILPWLLLLFLGLYLLPLVQMGSNGKTRIGRNIDSNDIDSDHSFSAMTETVFMNILKSIDPVDIAMKWNQIETLDCRKRAVCEVQRKLSSSVISHAVMTYISDYLPGLSAYDDAVQAGQNQEDCERIYSGCKASLVEMLAPKQ